MSHYEINYNSIENRKEKMEKAIADSIEYMGETRWNKLLETYYLGEGDDRVINVCIQEQRAQVRRDITAVCGLFLGISGYPVTAISNHILTKHLEKMREN